MEQAGRPQRGERRVEEEEILRPEHLPTQRRRVEQDERQAGEEEDDADDGVGRREPAQTPRHWLIAHVTGPAQSRRRRSASARSGAVSRQLWPW